MLSIIHDILYYIYILLFAEYVSIKVACGSVASREWRVFALICPLLLILQGVCLHLFGMNAVWMLYPLITHIPTVLAIIFLLKAKWSTALVSVVISYTICQLLRWIGLVIDAFELIPAAALIIHLSLCQLLLMLLNRYCLRPIHDVIESSSRLLIWFSALPVLYYLYEYFTIYTHQRFVHYLALNELIPTAMVLFFILFVIAYQRETEKREHVEHQNTALETELAHAAHEIDMLRVIEDQTAIYRHDLRHHLMMIDSLLSVDNAQQAASYIRKIVDEIEAIVPVRYCENETLNLLLSAFAGKSTSAGVSLSVKANLPQNLNLPDTELCAILSNGLENALNAVRLLQDHPSKTIDVFCGIKQNNLLIEIKNPYAGQITIRDGLPQPDDHKRHYGCRSIQSIVQRRNGVCRFDTTNHIFIMQVALPLYPQIVR